MQMQMGIRQKSQVHEWGNTIHDGRKMTSRGWTEAGIQQFNTLCHMVRGDRQANPAMVRHLKVWWSKTHNVPKQI
jgi:hypothetical protein